jgi:hypothetical protein
MFNGLKAEWWRFRSAPVGHRFVACYERHQAREAAWMKPVLFFLAIFSLVIGIVLAFIPGPAILFFAISGALFAAESRLVATTFDRVEAWGQPKVTGLISRHKHRDARATTKALSPKAAAVIAARAEVMRKQHAELDAQQPAARRSAELPSGETKLDAEVQRDAAQQKPEATPDAAPQRDAVMPPAADAAPKATVRRSLPVRIAGTVKLWSEDLPAPKQQSAKQTARARKPRKLATKPSIRTLPPPMIIGVEKA